MKKKLFSVMLVAALTTSLLAGCGKNKKTDVDNTETQSVVESTQQTEADKVITVSSDMANITGNLGKGVALDCVAVSTDTEEYKAVEEYLKDTNSTFEMYDINLLDKSKNKVQPDGMVEVSVKLSDTMKNAAGDAYVVFHNQGTDFTKIACTEKDGYVTFKTNHFSIYTVVKYDSKDEATTEKINAVEEEDMGTDEAGKAALKSDGVDKYVEAMNKTVYATDNLVVRSGPNNQFTKLGTLSAGDSITVTGQYEENGWYQIDYNGTKAYVSSLYVSEEAPKADNSESNNNEIVNDVKNEPQTSSSNAGKSQNNSSSGEQNVASNTGNTTQEPAQQPQQPEQTEPAQPSEPSQPTPPSDSKEVYIPDGGDTCPYETLKWTYYQGHFGFFSASNDPDIPTMDMSVALYPKGGTAQTIMVGSYKDTGVVQFLYNDEMNENTVVMP